MIVCHCAGVSDATLEEIIDEGVTSVPEVTRRCGAGACCAPCRDEIAAMLYAARVERQNLPNRGASLQRRAA